MTRARRAVDVLRVTVDREDEVYADGADLLCSVQGSNLVSAGAAVARAREVNALVEDLATLGVLEEHVRVQGIQAEVQGGLLTRSSTAEYRLRIRCPSLAVLPEVVERVGTRKNAALHRVEWRYEGLPAVLDGWLKELLARAQARAALVAAGLGHTLGGVHRFSEELWDPDRPPPVVHVHHTAGFDADGAGLPMAAPRGRAGGALGFPVAHSKRVRLVIHVDWRVAPA